MRTLWLNVFHYTNRYPSVTHNPVWNIFNSKWTNTPPQKKKITPAAVKHVVLLQDKRKRDAIFTSSQRQFLLTVFANSTPILSDFSKYCDVIVLLWWVMSQLFCSNSLQHVCVCALKKKRPGQEFSDKGLVHGMLTRVKKKKKTQLISFTCWIIINKLKWSSLYYQLMLWRQLISAT